MKRSEINNRILRYIAIVFSIIFHPVFVPLYTVFIYFRFSLRVFMKNNTKQLEIYLAVVSVLIPLLFLLTLKVAGYFKSYFIKTTFERLFFSVIMLAVYFVITKKISQFHMFIELLPFFIGIFLSLFISAIANYKKFKPSLHSLAWGGALAFFMIWGFYTKTPVFLLLIILILLNSLIAAARVYLETHTLKEIFYGFGIGFLSQFAGFVIMYLFG